MDEDALRALLLQIEWGADEAVQDAPFDRLAPAPAEAAAPPSTVMAPHRPSQPAPPASRAGAAERATEAAGAAATLDELRAAIARFDGCALRDTATGPVLFEGNAAAGLLLVSGPPGTEEDRALRLHAGADGDFLDAMLTSIGLSRTDLLAVPVIPWRPPGGRPPSATELAIGAPFLHRLVVLARTRLAIVLGPLAARALLGPERRGRGQLIDAEIPGRESNLPCFPTASPDQLRRDPDRRAGAWTELRRLRRILDANTYK